MIDRITVARILAIYIYMYLICRRKHLAGTCSVFIVRLKTTFPRHTALVSYNTKLLIVGVYFARRCQIANISTHN